jgi:probable HAF family extracellular repeat protein
MNSKNKFAARLFLVVFFCSLAMAQKYKVTDLGVLPGDSGSAGININSSGQVTGCSDTSTSQSNLCAFILPSHAFLWSSGRMRDLGTLSGDDLSIGFGLNDSGAVVGFSENTQTGVGHGFLWTLKSGKMIDLGTLPGGNAYSDADAITSKGVIVGESLVSNGDIHAVLWTKSSDGKYHIHGVGSLPNALYTEPYYLNEENQVVGVAYFDQKETMYHGFRWSKAGRWKDLGTLPGGTNSFAVWINDLGAIAGMATSAKFPSGVAVYWDAAGKIHSIGTLKGGTSSFGDAINDAGQVLGHSTVAGGDNHAFLWSPKTGLKDLNNLIQSNSGWVLNAAYAINKSGKIVGYGTIAGANHAFLLTPK